MGIRTNGMGLPKGVEIHGDKPRIAFTWNGKRYRETLTYLKANKAGIEEAGRLRAEIVIRIKHGQFDASTYHEYFPTNPEFLPCEKVILFATVAQEFLNHLTEDKVSPATRDEYRKALQAYWMPSLGPRDIATITYRELRQLVEDYPWPSAKTRNNVLIPLRGVFKFASQDELIESDPAAKLTNAKFQREPLDPFRVEEVSKILAHMYQEFTGMQRVYAYYFELAFNTGMRTSELLALTWDDIDFTGQYARVLKSKVRSKVQHRTKTRRYREVGLNENAITALRHLKRLTWGHPSGALFLAPQTMQPIASYSAPFQVWRKVLGELGIRYRRPYNTRHTYASLALMNNTPVGLIAKQLGHSVITLTTTYAKWMASNTDSQLLNAVKIPSPSLREAEIGS